MTKPNSPDNFWEKVNRGGPGECWEWTAYRQKRGYGIVGWHGKILLAHRVALSLTDGDWENRLHVLHRCDNPPCCNPAHLWRGSQSENIGDCIAKGRDTKARGESVSLARLTSGQVIEIRQSRQSYTALARHYDVGKTTIANIRMGRTWRHL